MSPQDYERFLALLYILNQAASFHMANFLGKGKRKVLDVFGKNKNDNPLVTILCFSLMPNHFHLVLSEKSDGGISRFMGKLLTAYAMYFNVKNERSGPLFVRPFRSVHIESDIQFKHLFSYIHLNALDILNPKWREKGIENLESAKKFLDSYEYSSYPDFIGKKRFLSKIIDLKSINEFTARTPLDIREYEEWYNGYSENESEKHL